MSKTTISARVVDLRDELIRRAEANGWKMFKEPFGGSLRFQKEINGSLSDLRVDFFITGDVRGAEFDGSRLPRLVLEDLVLAILG
jgi:hypothetical protein